MRIGPFGVWEIVIIVVVVLLIFGPSRLPEMSKGVARSVRSFRKEIRDVKADLDFTSPEPARPARANHPPGSATSDAVPPASRTPDDAGPPAAS